MTATTGFRAAAVFLALMTGAAAEGPEIAAMISRLASESFAEREKASEEILNHAKTKAAEVEKALVEAYRRSPEPEIRFRSRSILMKHYTDSVGFVGIRYQNMEFADKRDERRLVVAVMEVVPSTPAATAGLQVGDMILAVNGQIVDPLEPALNFAKRIQMLGAGRLVTLKIARGAEEMDVKMTLARRSIPLAPQEAESLFKERIQMAEQEPAVH